MVSFKESLVKTILLIVTLSAIFFSLAGCQTVKGLGRDITTAGEAGERALEK